MGQQQLLIIVMATIVSMASVAMGMQAFAEGQRKANVDAMLDDALSIVADVRAWRLQPSAMGGGQGTALDGFSLTSIKYSTNDDNEYITGTGTFTAYASNGAIIVRGDNADNDNRVMVTVNGQGSQCMRTRITHTQDDEPAQASDASSCSAI